MEMNEKKNLIVNCDICDARNADEDNLSMYGKIIINTDILLTDNRSKEVLGKLPITCNAEETIEVEGDVNIMLFNGNYRLSGKNMPQQKAFLVVNGNLEIMPDAAESLRHYIRIIANGSMKCPESMAGCIRDITVNGSQELYPDDCIVLDPTFLPDQYFPLRAKEGARYYACKKVILANPNTDAAALAARNVTFITKQLIVSANHLESAVKLVDETTDLVVIPAGYSYVKGNAELSEALLHKYGASLYIDGNLTLPKESTPLIPQISRLIVRGELTLLPGQAEEIKKMDVQYEKMKIVKGKTLRKKIGLTVDRALLDISPDGITVEDCVHVTIDETLTPQEILDNINFEKCVDVICTPQQHSAVELVSDNVNFIGSREEKGKKQMLPEELSKSHIINAERYSL